MPPSAYIVGVGETRFSPARDDVSTTELAWEAVSLALADAGVELDQIDNAVTASQDFWEGRTISSMAVNEVVAGTLRSESKVAADGLLTLAYAWARIVSGAHRLGLVLAHCKESQADVHAVEHAAFDPYVQRPLDPDETVAAALQARLLGYEEELRARVVAAARGRSTALPSVSIGDVSASPETATPLRLLERAPLGDGACALVVCDEEWARRLGRPAVRVAGWATCADPFWSDRDLLRAPALRAAVERALGMAGWDALPEWIELSCTFAHQALLYGEELGLGSPVRVVELIERGRLLPWGGSYAGRPGVVAGLAAAAACTRALRGVQGRALAHGASGLLGQSHHAVCLEGVSWP